VRRLLPTPAGTFAATTNRPTSRRNLLAGSAKLAAAGALSLGLGGLTAARGSAAAGDDFVDDLDVLRFLTRVEQMAYALYDGALRRFNLDEHNEDRLIPRDPTILPLRDQEQSHLAALTAATDRLVGPRPTPTPLFDYQDGAAGPVPRHTPLVAAPRYDFGYADHAGFLRVAAEVEDALVAAYAAALVALRDPGLRELAAGVLAVEARHAAHLGARLGADPFPIAIEAARPRVDVAAVTRRFVAR
jgi:hypothetical protein